MKFLLSDQVKQLLAACSLKQTELAEVLGVPLHRVKSLSSGKVQKFDRDEIRLLVEKLNLSGHWLTTGEGEMFRSASDQNFSNNQSALRQASDAVTTLDISDQRKQQVRDILFAVSSGKTELIEHAFAPLPMQSTDQLVLVPRYEVQASAGGGALIHSEMIVNYLAFEQTWVAKMGLSRDKLALIEVHGDSMVPELNNQDLILVDMRMSELSANGIYVIQLNGHLLVKRIQTRMDGSVTVISDNPKYAPEPLTAEQAQSLIVLGLVVWSGRRM